ncbi:unnamed protein product [Camellia sinensis]
MVVVMVLCMPRGREVELVCVCVQRVCICWVSLLWVCMHGSGNGVVHAEREGGGACVCMCSACMHLLGVPLGCVNVYQYVCMCVK